ncbi:MAG: glycoside hydrolase family 99-like domain-containing protein, partial [Clostridia bacterium]|nr:glycoside hydrolase family 99-like domain-containing protein [Clostridia bacterium]
KNAVESIPDVSEKQSYHGALVNLYKAGVVMGSDSYGNFRPEDNRTRAEAAAIINRVALPENRLSKTLDKISNDDAYTMIITENFTGTKEGINSGWVLDNRGATPRTTLTAPYSSLFDVDNTAPSAFIREFNKTETGVFDLYTTVNGKGDGIYLEFRNDKDESIYRVITKDGKWNIAHADSTLSAASDFKEGEKQEFHIRIDLDNARSTTYIDDVLCGTYPLCAEANLYNFRFATTDECVGSLTPGFVHMYANYPVFEDFTGSDMPKFWTALGNASVSDALKIGASSGATTSFSPVSGKVVTEFIMLLPGKESVKFYAKSGAKKVIEFASDDKNFYVNGSAVYENYLGNMWYIIRTELDTDTGKVLVKLNGRKVAEVDVKDKATSIDNISFINESSSEIKIDDVKVYRLIEHDDYVPVPVKPEGADDYVIGMNVCSLWTNGTHYGWSCISPYSDNEPVLGYYDEGNPETADWEIKYLVEHGIDFQAFCVFFRGKSGVQRLDAGHLYNGFMNAKYSDMANYCIIWEAGNGGSPGSVDEMKKNFAPYIVEYFFKDSRYMVIDNKPVVCVFGADNYASNIGGNENAKASFDVLEEEAKKLGFDGVIFLVCGKSSQNYKDMGYDGCYAYNWGVAGYQASVNKEQNLGSASNDAIYTVPTVSVGFNNIAWNGEGLRNPMMSFEDYKATHEWVRDEYIPEY